MMLSQELTFEEWIREVILLAYREYPEQNISHVTINEWRKYYNKNMDPDGAITEHILLRYV